MGRLRCEPSDRGAIGTRALPGRVRQLSPPDGLRSGESAAKMRPMNWTTPVYEQLKMDAEIGSYQEDGEWPPIAEPTSEGGDDSDGG